MGRYGWIVARVAFVVGITYVVTRLWAGGDHTFALAIGIGGVIAALGSLLGAFRRGIKPWHPTRLQPVHDDPPSSIKRIHLLGRLTVVGLFVGGAILLYREGYWTIAGLSLLGGVYNESRQIVSALRAGRSPWIPTEHVRDER